MSQYRQVLVRLRAGDSEREIARTGVMGREKLAALHASALAPLRDHKVAPLRRSLTNALKSCD